MKQKIAVLSDVHGNITALKAVLKDAEKNNAQEVWSMGDIAIGGSSMEECFQLLGEVNTTQYLMGNWETAFLSVIATQSVDLDNPSQVYFANLVQYDYEHLTPGRIKQVKELPLTSRKTIENITFSLTHNLPTTNRGHELFAYQTQANFDELNIGTDIDVAIYAHTHTPLWRYTTEGQMILNPGSVGQPWYSRQKLMKNRDASYMLLTLSDGNVEDVDFRRVKYDIQAELNNADQLGFPYPALYKELLTTGHASTHDREKLKKINLDRNYRQKAKEFLIDLSSK
ncbi:metallophosphoesterase family protein [Companilactobacillus kimchiensis]|uniref:Diadenosine tetraphosphatase-like protein n=1 Tax=Companilactobacillus kimchiensis TaxID=993692 RepID=A0A0R2LMY4_9LACO|nr:metallophosphoesterase family protein [Companilactobacillus kimchiensis]KRO00035.1 diadenosine tetraphosphatase-like protein [Companilactobacillus kimchiensis]